MWWKDFTCVPFLKKWFGVSVCGMSVFDMSMSMCVSVGMNMCRGYV